MFGYATNETPEYMPLTISLAHKLNQKMTELRKNGVLGWLRPDSKTQVTRDFMCRLLLNIKWKTVQLSQSEYILLLFLPSMQKL